MNKAIFTILLFCFAIFSASAQVENKKTDPQKNTVEQNKIAQEKMDKEKALGASQTNQQADNPNAPVITFDKMVHDYGTLTQNDEGKCEFKFTNEGKEPLILSNVRAS